METKEYRLTDICDFQGGTQPPKEEWINEPRDGFVRMLQIRDFTQGKEEHIAYVKDTKKLNKCEQDDILIGRYGASVGKILTGLAGAYNVAIIKTIPKEELLSKRYLYYVLTGTEFQNFILNIGARAAQAGFNKNDLSLFKLHIPTSLKDQESIANVLEKSRTLIDKREKSIGLLDEFLKMEFIKMFGTLSSPKFPTKPLNRFTLKITDGTHQSPKFTESGIPFLFVSNIKNDEIVYETDRFISEEEYDVLIKRTPIEIGDILYTSVGSYGNPAIVKSLRKFCFQRHIAYIKPDKTKISYVFLFGALKSDFIKVQVERAVRGAAQKTLNLSDLKMLLIPDVPKNIQLKYAEVVDSIEKIKKYFILSQSFLNELHDSLCSKALKGELGIIEKVFIEGTIKVQPKLSGEVVVVDKINKELEEFHKSQPHTGAPDEIDNTIRQLEAELKLRGEIPFWDEYVKYRIVKGKFKEPFTFDQLWEEITKFPFETVPEYDEVATLLFKWLSEENAFIRQQFNESTKQIELVLNETAKA